MTQISSVYIDPKATMDKKVFNTEAVSFIFINLHMNHLGNFKNRKYFDALNKSLLCHIPI